MKFIYHIYNLRNQFVGFANDVATAELLAKGHDGWYVGYWTDEFKWD